MAPHYIHFIADPTTNFHFFFILNLFVQGNNSELIYNCPFEKKTLQNKVFKPTDKQVKIYFHFKSIISIKPMPTKERNKGRKSNWNYPALELEAYVIF